MGEIQEVKERTVKSIFSHYQIGMFFILVYFAIAMFILLLPYEANFDYQNIDMDWKSLLLIEFRPCYYAGKYINTMFSGVEIFFNQFETGFRYFPLTSLLYAWCNLVTYEQARVIYVIMIFTSDLVTAAYIGKLAKNDYGVLVANIYLSTPIHAFLMLAGNTSSFGAMFLILGYYLLKKHRSFSAGLMFAIAILYKPLLLCVVPFLIAIKNRKILIKDSIRRLAGVALLLLPNLLIYIVNPAIIQAFIGVNFGGSLNPTSNSISIPIHFLLNIDPGTVFWVLFFSLETFLFVLYYLRRDEEEHDYFRVSLLLALSTFVGSWLHYYLFYSAFAPLSFTHSSKHDHRMNLWIHISYVIPWQLILSALVARLPIWSLYVVNLVVSIPYMMTLFLEYKLIIAKIYLPRVGGVRPGKLASWFQGRASNSTNKSTQAQQDQEHQLIQESQKR